jgi:hypothetical protein
MKPSSSTFISGPASFYSCHKAPPHFSQQIVQTESKDLLPSSGYIFAYSKDMPKIFSKEIVHSKKICPALQDKFLFDRIQFCLIGHPTSGQKGQRDQDCKVGNAVYIILMVRKPRIHYAAAI